MSLPLEPSRDALRALTSECVEFVLNYIDSLPSRPSNVPPGPDVSEAEPPSAGRPISEVLSRLADALRPGLQTAGPGYLAYIPGGGLYAAALADFMADATNKYVGIWGAAPGCARIELDVVRWLCDMMGYPPAAMGVLTTGGSLANLSAVITARVHHLGEEIGNGVVYTTEQAHHSVHRAARLAGIRRALVRDVPTENLRMSIPDLQSMMREDRQAGRQPFLIVGSGGTTNTGTVDPLDRLADVAAENDVWFHCDAAYGGFFRLTRRGAAVLNGIERADSITLDPHKGLFLPYGTGGLVVRDGERLRAAHAMGGAYLQDLGEFDRPSFADYSPEQSRDFRGLRVWLAFQLHGLEAFRQALDEKLDLAAEAFEVLSANPQFEVLAPPELSMVAFRARPPRGDADAFNRRLQDAVNAEEQVMLSSTVVGGQVTLRLCILSFRTHAAHVRAALDALQRHAARLQ